MELNELSKTKPATLLFGKRHDHTLQHLAEWLTHLHETHTLA
jgi:hypothetical protein